MCILFLFCYYRDALILILYPSYRDLGMFFLFKYLQYRIIPKRWGEWKIAWWQIITRMRIYPNRNKTLIHSEKKHSSMMTTCGVMLYTYTCYTCWTEWFSMLFLYKAKKKFGLIISNEWYWYSSKYFYSILSTHAEFIILYKGGILNIR